MAFTVTGQLVDEPTGRPVTITWADGDIYGADRDVDDFRARAAAYDGVMIGPIGGPRTYTDHLSSALSARALFHRWFVPATLAETGDLPVPDAMPDGWVS